MKIPSNFRIEILAIRTLLCALGTEGLNVWTFYSPEIFFDLTKAGPLEGLVAPALAHEGVEARGAVGGQGQPLPVVNEANDIIVFDALEWLDA